MMVGEEELVRERSPYVEVVGSAVQLAWLV